MYRRGTGWIWLRVGLATEQHYHSLHFEWLLVFLQVFPTPSPITHLSMARSVRHKDTLTVNFAKGRSTVTKKDQDALTDFVKAAANTPGFMIEVQGYASTVVSAVANQRRACRRCPRDHPAVWCVPMTRILAPAAMGTSNQVDPDHTRKAQAENRRVVVTIVVSKGIAPHSVRYRTYPPPASRLPSAFQGKVPRAIHSSIKARSTHPANSSQKARIKFAAGVITMLVQKINTHVTPIGPHLTLQGRSSTRWTPFP